MSLSVELDKYPESNSTSSGESSVTVSVVIPVVERCGNLNELYRVHAEVLNRLGHSFEFVFVFDSRFEEAALKLDTMRVVGEPIRIVTLPRPFGEATALTVGFEQAQGEILIVLSSYLQVIPDGIAEVLQRVESGYDLVVARRFPRLDSWMNRVQTRGFHCLVRLLTGIDLHDISCGLKGIRRRVAQETQLYGDLHRFFPLLAHQRGFRIAEVDVPQHPADGQTRLYHPGIYLRRLLDILTLVFLYKFTKKPLRFFGLIGVGLFSGGFLLSLILAIQKIIGLTALTSRPLLILGVLLMVLGVQTGSIGLLGEMIIFTHARRMKDYTVEKILR